MQADHPIHLAARRGDLSEVQRMVTEDPSLIELRTSIDHTPLTLAALHGHAAIVEWLIDYGGANIDAQGHDGWTGLHLSSFRGHLKVVSILVNRGADINRANGSGGRPLMEAALHGHVAILELLLSQEGINLDAQDEGGKTAVFYATCYSEEEELRPLLAAGADPRIANNFDGRTPLDMARDWVRPAACIRLLEAALAEPERARVLHRARAINDAHHAINKAITETDGRTRGERRRKILAATPAYLKGRVERSEELPQVEVRSRRRRRRRNDEEEEEEEKLAAVVEHMVMDGQVPSEVFVELMEMMIPKWDDERRRV